jgi:clan AA aspartic protease
MIAGRVIDAREAIVTLTVRGSQGHQVQVAAVIDTGFTDYLTLPRSLMQELRAPFVDTAQCQLADGRFISMESFEVTVEWHDSLRECLALAAEGEALAGMSLLSGSRVTMDVVAEGELRIEPIG